MIRVGLTGGIAAGKSTIAKMLHDFFHIPIFDADKAVHQLYHHPGIINRNQCFPCICISLFKKSVKPSMKANRT